MDNGESTKTQLPAVVNQSNSVLSPNSNQAGRDINICVESVDYNFTYLAKEYFAVQEVKDTTEIGMALQHYMLPNDPKDQVEGLEKKLLSANRDASIDYALTLKHEISKRLEKVKFSTSGQKLYQYILQNCYDRFATYALPAIKAGKSNEEIDVIVYEKVISPMVKSLKENPLGIMNNDIRGSIYYLTGNCHIRWN